MKKYLFILMLTCLGISSFAQDVITKKDGSVILVEVLTVGSDGVRYRMTSEPYGNVYFLSSDEFVKSKYKKILRENMKYKELRKMYRTRDYVHYENAAYLPGLNGLFSSIVPGLGECMAEEWGRGIPKFLGFSLLAGAYNTCIKNEDADMALVALAGGFVVWLWSIIDAVKISKIKNMYIHDYMKMYGMELNLTPSVSFVSMGESSFSTAGLTLSLNF